MTPDTPASAGIPLARRNPAASLEAELIPPGMPLLAEKQVIEWVHDAFAIISRRGPPLRVAESNLHRGLTAIVRHVAMSTAPLSNYARDLEHDGAESPRDLHLVMQTLDACLALFARHDRQLNTAQRRVQILVRACRRNAEEALQAAEVSAAPLLHPARR